jgi:two-component system chemotaxis response regulator CheB
MQPRDVLVIGGSAGSIPPLRQLAGALPADLEAFAAVTVAPPDHHLLFPAGVAELSHGPKVNRSRPAIDAMFGSAARWFSDRVVAVVLSGVLDDGAVGAALVAQAGGQVVVQEPAAAAQWGMPEAALAAAPGAIAAPAAELGKVVTGMLGESGLAAWPRPLRGETCGGHHGGEQRPSVPRRRRDPAYSAGLP